MLTAAMRATVCACVLSVAGAGTAAAAAPWGVIDCSQSPSPTCDVAAGTPGSPGHVGPTPPVIGQASATGGGPLASNCTYVASGYTGPAGSASGPWYTHECTMGGPSAGLPVQIPQLSPGDVARIARSQLRLPSPVITSSPAGTQLVRLPTWLWLDRASWRPYSSTASVPGVSVMVTATPAAAAWSMGDGTTLTCTGPGTAFHEGGDPHAASPDCGHTYHRSSAGAPNERFPVIATVNWTITWSGAGTSGTLPDLTTSASTAFRVAETQALGIG